MDSGDAIRVSVLVCATHSIPMYHVCSKSKCVENNVINLAVLHLEFGGLSWVRKNHQDRG